MHIRTIFGRTYNVTLAYFFLFLLLLPTVIFLTNSPVWDDPYVFEAHSHWSWGAMFGQYLPDSASYWRPLTVLTIVIPNLIGVPIWANKLIGVFLFFIQGCLAIAVVDVYLRSRKEAISSIPIICLGIVLATHPVFVESILWISARGDLLLGIFVLLGLHWILTAHELEHHGHRPQSILRGFLWGVTTTFLACSSKDTGIAWAGLAFFTVLILGWKSDAEWKRYWIYSAAAIFTSAAGFMTIRSAVLKNATGISSLSARHTTSWSENLQLFSESFFRSIANIFAPMVDQAPFKTSGWFSGFSPFLLVVLLLIALTISAFVFNQLYKKNKTAAFISFCALAIIIFHSALTTFSEPTLGSILSNRYLSPSAILIFIALTIASIKSLSIEPSGPILLPNKPIAFAFSLMLVQALALWTSSRLCWENNVELWGMSWNHGSQSKMVAENYSIWSLNTGDFPRAKQIAQFWLDNNPALAGTSGLCKFYAVTLEADVKLNDFESGTHYAKLALPIGSCNFGLANNIAFFLKTSQCKQVLPMIYQTIAVGDRLPGNVAARFRQSDQRKKLIVNAADAESRCGDKSKALALLQE